MTDVINKDGLISLEMKLSAADCADRGLDGIIARDIAGWIPHFDLEGDEILEWPDMGGHWHKPKMHPKTGPCKARSDAERGFTRECPAYTGSLDAAIALVERTWPDGYWEVRCNPFAGVRTTPAGDPLTWVTDAKTPALALCLALVRSLLQNE